MAERHLSGAPPMMDGWITWNKNPNAGLGRDQIRITKSEIPIQNTNAPMYKTATRRGPRFWSFEFGSLGIVSDFVLRISDFQILRRSAHSVILTSCDFASELNGLPLPDLTSDAD